MSPCSTSPTHPALSAKEAIITSCNSTSSTGVNSATDVSSRRSTRALRRVSARHSRQHLHQRPRWRARLHPEWHAHRQDPGARKGRKLDLRRPWTQPTLHYGVHVVVCRDTQHERDPTPVKIPQQAHDCCSAGNPRGRDTVRRRLTFYPIGNSLSLRPRTEAAMKSGAGLCHIFYEPKRHRINRPRRNGRESCSQHGKQGLSRQRV